MARGDKRGKNPTNNNAQTKPLELTPFEKSFLRYLSRDKFRFALVHILLNLLYFIITNYFNFRLLIPQWIIL